MAFCGNREYLESTKWHILLEPGQDNRDGVVLLHFSYKSREGEISSAFFKIKQKRKHSQILNFLFETGAEGQNRTADTGIFSPNRAKLENK